MFTDRHIQASRQKALITLVATVLLIALYNITYSPKIIFLSYGFISCAIIIHTFDIYKISSRIKRDPKKRNSLRKNLRIIWLSIITMILFILNLLFS